MDATMDESSKKTIGETRKLASSPDDDVEEQPARKQQKTSKTSSSSSSCSSSKGMRLRADFSVKEVVDSTKVDWVDSPAVGVQRRMLDRIGDEVARATTVVKYDPGSKFPRHTHSGGEEFLVLKGTFYDQYGTHKTGAYVRNYIGSSHAPWVGDDGCEILVKLHQMNPDVTENPHTSIDTEEMKSYIDEEEKEGSNKGKRSIFELYKHEKSTEAVRMELWKPNVEIEWTFAEGGEEVFVVSGSFTDDGDEGGPRGQGSWLRTPPGSSGQKVTRRSGESGCKLWVKTGHLTDMVDKDEK